MAAINYSIARHVLDNAPVPCSEPDFNRFYKRIKKLCRTIGITANDTKSQLDAKKAQLPYIWHAMKDVSKGRNAPNAGDRDVLFMDMDGCSGEAWNELKEVLKYFSCFVYSTPSHLHPTARGEQRWRVCFELGRTVSPEEYKRLGPAVESWLMDCVSLLADYAIRWDHSVYNPDHMVYGPDEAAVFERFTGEPVDVDMLLARTPEIAEKGPTLSDNTDWLERAIDLNGITQQTFDDLRSAMWHPTVLADAQPQCGRHQAWASMGNRLAWFKDTEWEDLARRLWLDWSEAGGGSADDVANAAARWDEDKLKADRTGYSAIFALAQKRGWKNPAAERIRETFVTSDANELPRAYPHVGGYGKPGKFVIEGLIPLGVVMAYGASSSFKSYFIISLLCRIAMKTHRWGGRNLKGGAVLYVAAEGGSSVMPRVGAWADKYNAGKPLDLFYTLPAAVDLSVPANVKKIIEEIKRIALHTGEPVRAVAIDTLSQSMMQGEENSASDIAKFMAGATKVFTETGATVIIVHHSGKDSSKGMRGSSAAFANADAVIRVERIDDAVNLINEKQRTGPAQPTRGYMVPTVPLPDAVIAENEAFDPDYTSTEGDVYDPVRLTTERVFEDVPLAEITPLLTDRDDEVDTTNAAWIREQIVDAGGRISRAELRERWKALDGDAGTLRKEIKRMRDNFDIVESTDGFISDALSAGAGGCEIA